MQLGCRVNVLPTQQEPHEGRRGDRFNFPAQGIYGRPVDARQYAAVAELFLFHVGAETASEHHALVLQAGEGVYDVVEGDTQPSDQFGGGQGTGTLHPAAHYPTDVVLPGVLFLISRRFQQMCRRGRGEYRFRVNRIQQHQPLRRHPVRNGVRFHPEDSVFNHQ